MVASLAPKNSSIGRRMQNSTAVSASDSVQSMRKALARMARASSFFPSPRRMLMSGAPPTPMSEATELTIVMTGPQMPTPARASSPTPAMLPMYMRSTMLYSTLTNCASMLGSATRSTSGPIGSRPRSFACFMFPYPFVFPTWRAARSPYYSARRQKGKPSPRSRATGSKNAPRRRGV